MDVPLRDYVDMRFDAQDKAVAAAHEALSERLHAHNGLLGLLKERADDSVSRREHVLLCDRVSRAENEAAKVEGRASHFSVMIAYALTAASLLISAAALSVTVFSK